MSDLVCRSLLFCLWVAFPSLLTGQHLRLSVRGGLRTTEGAGERVRLGSRGSRRRGERPFPSYPLCQTQSLLLSCNPRLPTPRSTTVLWLFLFLSNLFSPLQNEWLGGWISLPTTHWHTSVCVTWVWEMMPQRTWLPVPHDLGASNGSKCGTNVTVSGKAVYIQLVRVECLCWSQLEEKC